MVSDVHNLSSVTDIVEVVELEHPAGKIYMYFELDQ